MAVANEGARRSEQVAATSDGGVQKGREFRSSIRPRFKDEQSQDHRSSYACVKELEASGCSGGKRRRKETPERDAGR